MNLKALLKLIKIVFILLISFVFLTKSQAQNSISINKMNLMKKNPSDSFVFIKYEPQDFFYKDINDTMVDANSFRYTVIDSFIIGLRFDSFECCKYALGFLINEKSGSCFIFKTNPFIQEKYSGQTYFLNVNHVSFYNQDEDVFYQAYIGYHWAPIKKVLDFKNGYEYTFYRNDKKEVGTIILHPNGDSVFEFYGKLLLNFKNIRAFQSSLLKEKKQSNKDETYFRASRMTTEEMKQKKEVSIYSGD